MTLYPNLKNLSLPTLDDEFYSLSGSNIYTVLYLSIT